jgi:ferredoxin/flavodoxin---NADP+ reductase
MTPRIAIVGSGPSGFFTAEALLKSSLRPQVHMFDRLPTPFGLVRSGVAPDHTSIKTVSRIFDKIAEDKSFEFYWKH